MEEIALIMVVTQILTVIIFCGIVSYMCSKRYAAADSSEIEKLVQTKVEEILRKR